ncbi:hypothetical protein EXU85_33330 [Spirosoma sp. KCTC 42546]|uniref:hypothetical protein n=1 Tax=Spirosoma sp. KCTC 42546 TaxID=2520506 RepID=UPI0011572ED4|nr:hypothetical protein [Spirosoma sp. KCTC 42546]QDK83225.1 hypothetical protein EXU85_33330 [Spirosoma sp. KCTC 42546]
MKPYYLLVLLVWAACVTPAAVAQDSTKSSALKPKKKIAANTNKQPSLFDLDRDLEFTLTANLRDLTKDRGDKPITHAAVLTYTNGSELDTLPLTLKVRGNFRRSKVNCTFPPLLIDLPKKKVKKTLFAHQNKVKLVTHCQNDEWVVREYLVYKLYNLLTDLSFRAQLARVTYADSLGKRAPETHWSFLLEDESDLAKRNNVKLNTMKQIGMGYADSLGMATVAVFEYMIGNTDWSVPYLHNIRLFANGVTSSLPVPYDFDHAGIVEASYAKPAEQLGLSSVRERVYRGPTYPMPLLQQVFDKFNQIKPQVYALYQNDSRLDKTYVKRTVRYLDDFYALLSKPASARAIFRQNVQSGVVIKGLN